MTTTLALTGELPFVLIVSGCLGLLFSFLLLRLYRRALRRGMARSAGKSLGPQVTNTAQPALPPPTPLAITYLEVGKTAPPAADSGALYLRARSAPWRAGTVYGLAGVVFAAVLALAFLWSGGVEFRPLRFLVLFWVYAWPLVLSLSLVVTTTRREKLLIAAAYTAGYVVLTLAVTITSPGSSPGQLVALWTSYNLPPSLLFLAFLLPGVRAVGSMVVTFLVFAVSGTSFLLDMLAGNPGATRSVADFFTHVGLGGTGSFIALIVIGLALFGVVGWFVLEWLRRGYQSKWVNDQSLILDALWLFFGVSYSMELAFEGASWATAGLVAFALYLATVRLGFRLVLPSRASGPNLLILRVFALGRRSEILFRSISKQWRYIGTVQLIAGPDLASATVEPHEFLDFVSGRLKRQFINNVEELDRHVDELDTSPDFDGRFRINDFFCHEDTWQPTLAALVHHSSAVLLDLREFTSTRQGVIYEIRQLLQYMPLTQIVMLVDATTDHVFLEQVVAAAWEELPACAPNRAQPEPQLSIIEGGRAIESDWRGLLAAICTAATR